MRQPYTLTLKGFFKGSFIGPLRRAQILWAGLCFVPVDLAAWPPDRCGYARSSGPGDPPVSVLGAPFEGLGFRVCQNYGPFLGPYYHTAATL